jgi:Holliday junction resolvase RusA-like endonuclease
VTEPIVIWCPGIPKPGGSKRPFLYRSKKDGKLHASMTDACKTGKDWRAAVALCATETIKEPLSGPLDVRYAFYLPRPRGHYRSGRSSSSILKPSAPARHIIRPDTTKLIRSTEDALKGIAWLDDSQCCYQEARKGYVNEPHPQPGCLIEIRQML